MSAIPSTHRLPPAGQRTCTRVGCAQPVKKTTAKYCSVGCSSTDPVRLARLRERTRINARAVLPMAHQLSIAFAPGDPEAVLAGLRADREDVPEGLSRLVC